MKTKNIVKKILWFLYYLSGCFPRSPQIWVFGSYNNTYTDNSKYLFLSKSSCVSGDKVKFIWISGSKTVVDSINRNGSIAYLRWSLGGLYHTLRAKYYFYNSYTTDINFWTCRKAVLINLWHGIPLKKIEFDIRKGPLTALFSPDSKYKKIWNHFFFPWHYKKPDFVLSPSDFVGELFCSAFQVTKDNLIFAGYPRNDILSKTHNKQKITNVILTHIEAKISNKSKTVIYMPTWRDDKSDFFIESKLDFTKLDAIFGENNALLLLKLHPNISLSGQHDNYKNIIMLESSIDVYSLFLSTDMLITDYSSVFFDYLIVDKPIVFYPFDLDTYLNENREFYFNYEDFVPGRIAKDFQELCTYIFDKEEAKYATKRAQMKNVFWKYQVGNSSSAIIDIINKYNTRS